MMPSSSYTSPSPDYLHRHSRSGEDAARVIESFPSGHNRQIYLRQLGRTYVADPERTRPQLARLEGADRAIVTAEVALVRVEHGQPLQPFAAIREELFDD